MSIFSVDSPFLPAAHSLYFSPSLITTNLDNRTLPILPFTYSWFLPFFILCFIGILLSIVILFFFIYFSFQKDQNQSLLPNIFICISNCLIYLILIISLIRGNEFICGLREFLFQFAYTLLYSSFLAEYLMFWLSKRISSRSLQNILVLLIFFLLLSIQIPIGILWWFFTNPQTCPQPVNLTLPSWQLTLTKLDQRTRYKSCSYQCLIDDRFYGTLTYVIFELLLLTMISIGLFLYRSSKKIIDDRWSFSYHRLWKFFHFLTFILIDFVWLIWSVIYHFTDPFFIFPSIIIGLFTIATLTFILILLPQLYFYWKWNSQRKSSILLTDNEEKGFISPPSSPVTKRDTLTQSNDHSSDIATSGTFLPITRTPRSHTKSPDGTKKQMIEKLDQLIYADQSSPTQASIYENRSGHIEPKMNISVNYLAHQNEHHPIQHQLTSSSMTSDARYRRQPSSLYYRPRRDESIIPILCTSDDYRTSTPVRMRILFKRAAPPSTSLLTRNDFYPSETDSQYVHQLNRHVLPSPPRTSLYYSNSRTPQYVYHDPYRVIPSYWRTILPTGGSHRLFHQESRLLSERLWDMDLTDEMEERLVSKKDSLTHMRPDYGHCVMSYIDDDVDDDEDEDDDDSS